MGRQRNYAGVDQTLHGFFGLVDRTPSNAFRISSGNGPSKSSAILMVSPYAPRLRLRSPALTGTSRATGTPRFAIKISSPAA